MNLIDEKIRRKGALNSSEMGVTAALSLQRSAPSAWRLADLEASEFTRGAKLAIDLLSGVSLCPSLLLRSRVGRKRPLCSRDSYHSWNLMVTAAVVV